jgi:hypothetical protein
MMHTSAKKLDFLCCLTFCVESFAFLSFLLCLLAFDALSQGGLR